MKRAAIVLLIALAAAVAARVASPAQHRHVGFSAALACGVERWNIKTLKDRRGCCRLGRRPSPT
jgi:hypothetical protein